MQPFGSIGHCVGGLFSHVHEDDLTNCLAVCATNAECKYASYRESAHVNCALYNTNTCTLNDHQEYKTFKKSGLYIFVYSMIILINLERVLIYFQL